MHNNVIELLYNYCKNKTEKFCEEQRESSLFIILNSKDSIILNWKSLKCLFFLNTHTHTHTLFNSNKKKHRFCRKLHGAKCGACYKTTEKTGIGSFYMGGDEGYKCPILNIYLFISQRTINYTKNTTQKMKLHFKYYKIEN